MHSSGMRTVRSSSRLLGGLPQCMLGYKPPSVDLDPPLNLHPWPGPRHPTPTVDRMTDTCKNITCENFVCGR